MKDRENDLIERLYTGDLTDTEDQEFRERLAEDRSFARAVGLQRRLRHQLIDRRNNSPVGKLLAHEAALASRGETVSRSLPHYGWAVAAAVLFLLTGGTYWWASNTYSDKALITRLHEPILDDTQAGLPQARDLLREAKRAYFSEDYTRAERLSAAISKADSSYYSQAQALNAYALFRMEEYQSAIGQFTHVIETVPIDPSFPAGGLDKLRWTRLLAYLGAGREKEPLFRDELAFFRDGLNESYARRARTLERSLRSGWRKITH